MMMPVQMTFRHVPLMDDTYALIRDLSAQLGRTRKDLTRCHVVVDRARRRRGGGGPFRVRVLMSVPGRTLVADRRARRDDGRSALTDMLLGTFETAQRLLVDDHDRRLEARNAAEEELHRLREAWTVPRPAPVVPAQAACSLP
jgi:hypothetical protein